MQFKKHFLFIFLLCGILLIISAFEMSPLSTYAQTAEDLRKQIEERNKNIAELEKQIELYKKEVNKNSAQAKTLQNKIKELELNGKKLDTDIALTQNKISAADLKIKHLGGEISEKENRINLLSAATAENLKLMHQEEDSNSFLHMFLSTKSLASGLDAVARLTELTNLVQGRVSELRGLKTGLLNDKKLSEEEKNKLEEFRHDLDDQKQVVVQNRNNQAKILTETKNNEAEYQKLLKNSQAQKAALEKEIFEYESKLKYILDPSSIPRAGTSPLAWPLDKVVITQLFGKTSASGRLYTSGSHNGVDFGIPIGTPVKAMGNGVVIGAGNTDEACPRVSFGSWVLIRYDNGLAAIFAHLSVIRVNEGQRVTTGETVALSGNTGYSTGPHLHVSVYPGDAVQVDNRPSNSCAGKILRMPLAAVNAYLDPMLYLPKQ
jgi:murein DD-endopeptidase MepM/ murein hydrolase activator NlpD